jgi:LysM repeat protein
MQPTQCCGQLYTVRAGDTLFALSRRFGVTIEQILAANPQIVNRDTIFIGQVICIPSETPGCDLRVLTLRFFTETGQPLPADGAVRLNARTIVRVSLNRPYPRPSFSSCLPVRKL